MAYKAFSFIKTALFIFIEILISVVLSILIVPIGLTLTLVNELVRLIISRILHLQNGSSPNPVSLVDEGADNIWSYRKANNGRMCLALLFCENQINLAQHRKIFMSRVINHTTKHGKKPFDKLRKVLITKYGYNCYKLDGDFDIQNHVKVLSGTEDVVVDECQLMEEFLPLLFKDMEESKPQWEEIIIPRFKFNDGSPICSVRIFRYHHGYMDGASNLLMWTSCMTDDQGASFPYAVNPLMEAGNVSKTQRILYDLSCVILCAFTITKSIINASRFKSRFVTVNYSGKRHFGWSESINVDIFKRIKSTCKASIPAILATAIGGAIRKLDEKYPNSQYGNPQEVVIGLVSALIPYANHFPRNQFTVVHFPVLTGSKNMKKLKEDDGIQELSSSLTRLKRVNQNMVSVGRDPVVYLNYFMFKFFGRFPNWLIQNMMENGGLPVVFSNVPLSTKVVEFWGNPVVSAAGWPPLLTNTGLGIITMKYADHMRFCAVTDEACLSPEALNYFLQEVTNELNDLADECTDFETVVHKAERDMGNSILLSNNVCGSFVNPKNVGINTITMDFRRGSFPPQIIEAME